jgi:hypothetical protein
LEIAAKKKDAIIGWMNFGKEINWIATNGTVSDLTRIEIAERNLDAEKEKKDYCY